MNITELAPTMRMRGGGDSRDIFLLWVADTRALHTRPPPRRVGVPSVAKTRVQSIASTSQGLRPEKPSVIRFHNNKELRPLG